MAGFVASGPGVLRVAAVDDDAELELDMRIELLPSGLLRSRAAVTNTGAERVHRRRARAGLPGAGRGRRAARLRRAWGRERVPQRLPFRVGTHLRENRRGRTGADSAYLLHAGTPGFGFAGGQIYAVHTAFSGNHVHYAERMFNGERVLGGGELLLPGEVRLGTGEQYTGPVDLRLVRHRSRRGGPALPHPPARRPRPVSADRPITLNVWEAVYFDHDLDHLVDLADRAATLGVERYVLDDGWFGARRHDRAGLGDWVVSAEVWPHGLHPLVDHVRGLGMQFGLWFEPEMVNPDSDVARAHPEWIMAARREWPVEARHQQVLNLGHPGGLRARQGAAAGDPRRVPTSTTSSGTTTGTSSRPARSSTGPARRARPDATPSTACSTSSGRPIPALEIESCSSGGGRVDLGDPRAHRPDLGVRLHRPARAPAHDCAGPPSSSRPS